jgi:hypothetical protein
MTVSIVIDELQVREKQTALNIQRFDKEYKEKVFQGSVKADDVRQHKSGAKYIYTSAHAGDLNFFINESKLKDKAASLKRGDEIIIKAKFKGIQVEISRFINVPNRYVAEFSEVYSIDLKLPIQAK